MPVADGRLPKPSPAGRHLAYVAAQAEGDRLAVADLADGPALPVPPVDGHIEALQWSPEGRHLLLVVAGIGADLSGHEGGFSTALAAKGGPAWLPEIETGQEGMPVAPALGLGGRKRCRPHRFGARHECLGSRLVRQ
ncbi:MAG: hypothetical protein WDN69_17300 [Aliidongia sp.]